LFFSQIEARVIVEPDGQNKGRDRKRKRKKEKENYKRGKYKG
jgi:hypothetical protein